MKLSALRGQRTKVREAALVEIEKVEKFTFRDASLEDGVDLLTTTNLLQQLAQKLESLDREILDHPEITEQELNDDVEFSTEFDLRMRQALARVTALSQSVHETSLSQRQLSSTPSKGKTIAFMSKSEESGITARPSKSGTRADPVKSGNIDGQASSTESQSREGSSLIAPRSYRELDFAPDKFDGNRAKYNRFISLFKSWIAKFPDLTRQEQLVVLAKHLEGEPRELVEALELTAANYDVSPG